MLKVWGELEVTPSAPSILLEFPPIPRSAPIFFVFFFHPFVFLSHNLSLLFTYSENPEVQAGGEGGQDGTTLTPFPLLPETPQGSFTSTDTKARDS